MKHEFDRTPSFAWVPVRGALRYEFELATSKSFTESSIVWSNANDEFVAPTTTTTAPATTTPTVETAAAKLAKLYANLRTPTVSIDLALPWITGSPYALYAHVRAITSKGPTSWSAPYGFNIRWSSVPKDLESPHRRTCQLVAGRGCDGVPGVALRGEVDLHDDVERRRRARPVHVPPHEPVLHGLDQVPRPRPAHALR